MKAALIVGGVILIFIVLLFGCMAVKASTSAVNQQGQAQATKAAPTPTKNIVVAGAVPGAQANWKGYPLPRPSWCVSPASWTMANLPSNRGVVPTCESKEVVGYLGYYPLQEIGCTPIVGIGAKVIPNGTVMEPNGLPSYGAYTVCAKTIPSTVVPTPK